MSTPSHALAAALALSILQTVSAQENCIELTTTAESEQSYINEQGAQATRLVPIARALPGDEVVWTVTAKNRCSKPADNIVIANPVPEHMTLVANTAMGVGTEITYSVDGREFKASSALSVRDVNGATRGVRPEEIRHIRWSYRTAFTPGATAFVRYRAIVD
ncbi:hypothetical protein [Povalibacter sp.]|uniref:hypothetical protein n=1 Tax=Povalibacter sp. TaxID=1962978 RepID=UPI002F3FE23F